MLVEGSRRLETISSQRWISYMAIESVPYLDGQLGDIFLSFCWYELLISVLARLIWSLKHLQFFAIALFRICVVQACGRIEGCRSLGGWTDWCALRKRCSWGSSNLFHHLFFPRCLSFHPLLPKKDLDGGAEGFVWSAVVCFDGFMQADWAGLRKRRLT